MNRIKTKVELCLWVTGLCLTATYGAATLHAVRFADADLQQFRLAQTQPADKSPVATDETSSGEWRAASG